MSAEETIVGELVHAGQPQSLVAGATPSETVGRHVEIANELKRIIETQNLSVQVQGKAHVRVEGWQALGLLCSITAVVTETEPVDGGFLATVEARRTTDGMVVGRAQAMCTSDERRGPWKGADRYALLSMAQTRATSKALKQAVGPLMALAGYQTTPAEEMPSDGPRAVQPLKSTGNQAKFTPKPSRLDQIRKEASDSGLDADAIVGILGKFITDEEPGDTAAARRLWIARSVERLDDVSWQGVLKQVRG